MSIELPEGLRAISPLVRIGSEGLLCLEVVATKSLNSELQIRMGEKVVGTKAIVAGSTASRSMQPVRVSSFWESWMYPAEDIFDAACPLESVRFSYPSRQLAVPFMPAGELGIILIFFIASMIFGIAVLKPLNITI